MTLVERSWVTVEVCVLTQKDWIFSLLGIDWYTTYIIVGRSIQIKVVQDLDDKLAAY